MKQLNEYLVNNHVVKASITSINDTIEQCYKDIISVFKKEIKEGEEIKLDPHVTVMNNEDPENPGTVTGVRVNEGVVELFVTWCGVISESDWDDLSIGKYFIEDLVFILEMITEK